MLCAYISSIFIYHCWIDLLISRNVFISCYSLCFKVYFSDVCIAIPVELFQILKDDAVKVLHSIFQQIWKTQQWPQDQKRSVFTPILKKGNAKECSNYHILVIRWIMLKILQARFQQYVNHELRDVEAGFRKGRGTRDRHPLDHRKSKSSKKKSTSAFLIMPKPLTVWITTSCGKFLKRLEYQITLPASWEICMQVRKK